jgi:hypothetical protein
MRRRRIRRENYVLHIYSMIQGEKRTNKTEKEKEGTDATCELKGKYKGSRKNRKHTVHTMITINTTGNETSACEI